MPRFYSRSGSQTMTFVPHMTVGEALALHPSAKWVFAAYRIGGCSNCAMSDEETLEQVATGYQLPLQRLISDLNALLPS